MSKHLLWMLVYASNFLQAQPHPLLIESGNSEVTELNSYLEIIAIPVNEKIASEQILRGESDFGPYRITGINISALWGKISFLNSSKRDQEFILRVSRDFGSGEITAFIFRGDSIVDTKKTTHFLSSLKNEVPHQHDMHIPIFLPRNQMTTVYIENLPLDGYAPFFDLKIYSQIQWQDETRKSDIFQAVFYGILIVFFLYNFILYLQTWDKIYFYYGLYMLSFSVFTAIIFNHFSVLFEVQNRSFFFMTAGQMSFISYVFFLQRFIKISNVSVKWYKPFDVLFKALLVISALGSVHLLLSPDNVFVADWYMRILSLFYTIYMIVLPILSIIKKSRVALYVMFGSLFLAVGGLISIAHVILFDDQTTIYGQVGILGEVLVFTIGLGYRMRLNEQEKQIAQENLIIQLKKNESLNKRMSVKLEKMVTDRTNEVRRQKEEIETKAKQLEDQNLELSRVNSFKDKLFAIIGHDLRGPLRNLKGILAMHTSGRLSIDELEIFTNKVGKSLSSLMAMLDNLLMWALQQMNHIEHKPTVVPLHTLAQENVDLLKPQAMEKEIKLNNLIDQDLEVFADSEMINIVIRNLVSNAIKFTKNGGLVEIEARSEDRHVKLSITDNGNGIPSTRLEKLFDEAVFSTNGTGNEKGTGLGLRLCSDFVKKNNGSISVTSELGKGSTFIIQLPRDVPAMIA
ncbi:MAG: sensor histidine kinase [Cyclobacteriaceae bacterium]